MFYYFPLFAKFLTFPSLCELISSDVVLKEGEKIGDKDRCVEKD